VEESFKYGTKLWQKFTAVSGCANATLALLKADVDIALTKIALSVTKIAPKPSFLFNTVNAASALLKTILMHCQRCQKQC
jgi:hypothetical protein